MAGSQLPIIEDDPGLDKVLGQLGRLRAAVRRQRHAAIAQQAPIEAEVAARSAELAEKKATSATSVAKLDQRSRALAAGVVRYVSGQWGRLKTSTSRIVRASGVKITRTPGKWSFETPDEDAAVAELRATGLSHLIRMRPTVNRQALHDCAEATEDGTGVVITVGEGADTRTITIKSIQKTQGPEIWKIEMPGVEAFEVTGEELADLLSGP